MRQKGRGIKDILRKGHDFVKSNRLVSRGLRHFGHNKLAKYAHMAGYGRRHRMRGRGIFGDIGRWIKGAAGKVHDFAKQHHLYSGALGLIPHPAAKAASAAVRLAGGRRRRRVRRRQGGRGRSGGIMGACLW